MFIGVVAYVSISIRVVLSAYTRNNIGLVCIGVLRTLGFAPSTRTLKASG